MSSTAEKNPPIEEIPHVEEKSDFDENEKTAQSGAKNSKCTDQPKRRFIGNRRGLTPRQCFLARAEKTMMKNEDRTKEAKNELHENTHVSIRERSDIDRDRPIVFRRGRGRGRGRGLDGSGRAPPPSFGLGYAHGRGHGRGVLLPRDNNQIYIEPSFQDEIESCPLTKWRTNKKK